MTPFEIFFGLTSVILGLALAEIASSLAKLLRAGRKVRWAPEPVLQSILITLIIVYVWSDQWWLHSEESFTVGQAVLQVAKLMALYVAAASVLTEPKGKANVDLKEHYYAVRRVTYGAMIVGLLLFSTYRFLYSPESLSLTALGIFLIIWRPAIYLLAAIVAWRPYHLTMLLILTIMFASRVFNVVIA